MSEIPSGHYGLNTIEDVFPKLTQLDANTNTDSGNYGRASVMTNAGEYIFIGDPDSQTVHVFTSNATSVSSHSTFSNTSVTNLNFGQSIDTDLYGSNVVVGGTNHASVWSLNGSGTAYTETIVVTKSTTIGGSGNGTDDFGRCVAMAKENNAWFAVGDYNMNNNQGRINLFEGGAQKAWYGGPTGTMPTKTGFSIGISGDGQYVITGNPGVPVTSGNLPWGTNSNQVHGSVSIHKYDTSSINSGGWNKLPTIKVFSTSELGSNVSAGYSVAMSTVNNIVAIGCPFANFTSHPKSGAIHLYQKSATSDDWNKLGDTINHSNGAGNFVRLTYNGRRLLASLEQAPFENSATRPKTFQIYDFNDLFWSVLEYIEGEFVDDTYGYPTSMSLEGTRLVLSGKNDEAANPPNGTGTGTGFITGMGKSKIMKIPPTVKTMGNTSVGGTVSCKDIVIGGGVVSTDKHSGMIVFSDTTGDEDKIAKILNRKYDGLNASNDGSELLFMKNGDSTGNKPDRIRIYGNQVVLQGGGSLTETDPNNEVFEDGYEFMCDPALTVSDTNVVNVGLNTGTIDFKVKYNNSKFEINGKTLPLRLHKGVTYKFDQSNGTNSGHRLKFVNQVNGANPTDGISQTLSGAPGTSGDTQVTFTSDAPATGINIFDSVNGSGTSYDSSKIDISIPQSRLNVTGDMNISGGLRANGSSGTSGQVLTSSGGGAMTWTTVNVDEIADYIEHTGNTITKFGFPSDNTFSINLNGTEKFRVINSGNVGIGTSSPGSKLDVDGDINVSSGSKFKINNVEQSFGFNGKIADYIEHDGDPNTYLGFPGSDQFTIFTGGLERFNIDGIGRTLIPNYITHSGDTDTFFGFPSNDTFKITTSNTDRFRVTSSGNIAIGTSTSPGYKLDVDGDINLTGSLRINGTAQSFGGGGSTVWTTSGSDVYRSSGKVGIGNTSQNAELDVTGTIHCNSIQTGTSQYEKHLVKGNLIRLRFTSGASSPDTQSAMDTYFESLSSGTKSLSRPRLAATSSLNTFADTFEGYLKVTTAGTHYFGLNSDDASDMYINGIPVAYWYGGHGHNGTITTPGGTQGSIYLKTGYHKIFVRFQENGGGEALFSLWKEPGDSSWSEIPANNCFYDHIRYH